MVHDFYKTYASSKLLILIIGMKLTNGKKFMEKMHRS